MADDELGGIAVGVRELVERFYQQLWNAWDDDAVDGILAEGFTFRGSLGQQTVGRDGWRTYRDQVRAAAPDFSNELVELVVDGDRAAARLRCAGTHRGLLLGLEGTGRAFATTVQHSPCAGRAVGRSLGPRRPLRPVAAAHRAPVAVALRAPHTARPARLPSRAT